jgi:prevent-host-death family protein
MKKVSITEAKNHLSALIDGLRRGAPVLIVDRGRPVARLEPVSNLAASEQDGRLLRLIREGVVRPARTALRRSLLTDKPPRMRDGASAAAALIEERREGR